jgi:hypothetical protein
MNITKGEAIKQIQEIIDEMPNIQRAGRSSSEHIRWILNCNNTLSRIFGKKSSFYFNFVRLPWKQTGGFVIQAWDVQAAIEEQHDRAFFQCLEIAQGIFLAAIDELNRTENIEDLYTDKTEDQSSLLIRLMNIFESKLRKLFRSEPKNEKDVQDGIENLLIAIDIQYSREKEHVLYSSKTYIPDFVIDEINLALEAKICGRENREKEIISEINDDILAYSTKYKNLMFIIYDIGQIRDVEIFKASFSKYSNVVILIIKH